MLLFLAALQAPVPITEALEIGGISRGGRRPTPEDAIVDQIVAGKWKSPAAGDKVAFRGSTRSWRAVKAGKDGSFEVGGGYLCAQIDESSDTVQLLKAEGDGLVYVNGAPRAGDPYGTGNLRLPVLLHKGSNDLLFAGGRGQIRAELDPMPKPIVLQPEDATLPDVLTTDRGTLWASVIAINGEPASASDLRVRAVLPDGTAGPDTPEGAIPALSARKLLVQIPVPPSPTLGPLSVSIQLWNASSKVDQTDVQLNVKNPLDKHKRTFVSGVDGSVQYFSVVPAAKPSGRNALVFTVHGAGVEAPSQTGAYAQKDWCTIVAPTNRRPYGFDWEDIGCEDFLDVERIAKRTYPHDPERVDLTGHSMGGHGTWSIGTLYPGLFASIGPSSGWVSFWSYAGGWNPELGLDTEKLIRRSMNVSDTLGRLDNTLSEQIYVLHGDADDNVPVQQARIMKAALEKIGHPAFQYHEQHGAGHWWGNQCVDWPPLFDMIKEARLDMDPMSIDFTTQDLNVSNQDSWLKVTGQQTPLMPSHVRATRSDDQSQIELTTDNVSELCLRAPRNNTELRIDGQTLNAISDPGSWIGIRRIGGAWRLSGEAARLGDPATVWPGRFKNVFSKRFMFVVGTRGADQENDWARDRARFDAETMLYRGNGAVDVVSDRDYLAHGSDYKGRNIVLYGNADTNRAWRSLLGDSPIQVREGRANLPGRSFTGVNIGGLVLWRERSTGTYKNLVGAVTGTGIAGFRDTDRLGLFTSGVAYPDWVLLLPSAPAGILADGFYTDQWGFNPADSAFASKVPREAEKSSGTH